MFEQTRRREEKKDQLEEREEAHLSSFTASVSIATEIQMQTFQMQLDQYDAATVEALMTNQEALDAVRERLDILLRQAHVLGDGRRVFKTEDGTQVFDEFGEEVGTELIAPEDIDDAAPSWETFSKEKEAEHALATEREQLLEFQEKLDETRAELDGKDVSAGRLEELDAELAALMPPEIGPPNRELEQTSQTVSFTTKTTWSAPIASPIGPFPG
ncbi:MAG: hypothetical protein AAF092_10150 [Pseudomonadota bacterium]